MIKTQKCTKRTNYVLGYTRPKFDENEVALIKAYKNWERWSPTNRRFKMINGDLVELNNLPEPTKPNLSVQLLEKKKMYDKWVKYFNSYYDKLY